MSLIKTPDEIAKLHEGGVILSRVLREIREACVPGASTKALDQIARDRFKEAGAEPSFLGYRIADEGIPYPGAVCISINEEVVHGLPIPDRIIEKGDVVGLDIGCWYKGLCTDMATTVIAGGGTEETEALVRDTRACLVTGLSQIKAGKFIHDIGNAIEDYIKPKGYGIVRDLVGHGVGHKVHEEPQVPNYRERNAPRIKLQEGMVLAIEPMITLGGWRVYMKDDQWTIATQDGSIAAHFEVTVVVTKTGYDLITPWPDA
ncbi:type I methionyl aminopeptidase [Patescibacteria group bacterium]|jgi:methionyl aminopeptidase|nr:type I methionyl aminopeptidase [Patescibacteria group bacterium]